MANGADVAAGCDSAGPAASTLTAVLALSSAAWRLPLREFVELAMRRIISVGVVGVHWVLSRFPPVPRPSRHTLAGTLLVSGAAVVMDQVHERNSDRLTLRRRHRPLPRRTPGFQQRSTSGPLPGVPGRLELRVELNLVIVGLTRLLASGR